MVKQGFEFVVEIDGELGIAIGDMSNKVNQVLKGYEALVGRAWILQEECQEGGSR